MAVLHNLIPVRLIDSTLVWSHDSGSRTPYGLCTVSDKLEMTMFYLCSPRGASLSRGSEAQLVTPLELQICPALQQELSPDVYCHTYTHPPPAGRQDSSTGS